MIEPSLPDAAEMPWEVLLTEVGNISAAATAPVNIGKPKNRTSAEHGIPDMQSKWI